MKKLSLARCPAHPDRTPSLAVMLDDDQRPRFHCYSGCSEDAVLKALVADLDWIRQCDAPPLPPEDNT